MEIRITSLIAEAANVGGTVVVIDVFRAFTTAAIALSCGARGIIMVDSLERALALREAGVGEFVIGERHGMRPPGFDFGNSPAEMTVAEVAGKVLIQTTTNGTACINAASNADRIYAGSFVTAEATVSAILQDAPSIVTLVAAGRDGVVRADEDELCALYLRSRLEGRRPDVSAMRGLLASMVPPPNPELVASGQYDVRDREIAADLDRVPFAVAVQSEGGLLIARAQAIGTDRARP